MMVAREQQRSKTVKKGEPMDHQMAVDKTRTYFEYRKKPEFQIDDSVSFWFDSEFRKQLPLNRLFPGHVADLAVFKKINGKWKIVALIEIEGDIGFWYMHCITNRATKANPTKHSKRLQKRNDKTIENWCERNDAKYITLKKEEILGDCKLDKEYYLTGLRHLENDEQLQEFYQPK